MATYLELAGLAVDADLLARTERAVTVAAMEIGKAHYEGVIPDGTAPNTANHRLWARYALDRPQDEAKKSLNMILALNKDVTLATVQALTDVQLQTQVDNVMPFLVQSRADR